MIITDQALYDALTPEQRLDNANSHFVGVVDDCYRCIYCEIGSWNTWKQPCPAK